VSPDKDTNLDRLAPETRVRHRKTGEQGIVIERRNRNSIVVLWDSGLQGIAHADHLRLPDEANVRPGDVCAICGDREPWHIHDSNGRRISDYFVVGRGQTDLEAARSWKSRALDAERRLAELELAAALGDRA